MDHIPNKTIRDDRFSERLFELFISVDKNIFFAEVEIICNLVHHSACEFSRRWGYSSAGRALRSQCRGRGFDPHYLHHFKLIIPFCIPFSKSSKIFFRLVLFQLKRSKFQIWNLKKNHKKNKEKRGCSGRESKFSVTCHRTAGRC